MKSIVISIIFFGVISVTFAHSGGTNSAGCHAGSQPYHCHNKKTSTSNKIDYKRNNTIPKYNSNEWRYCSRCSPYSDHTIGFYTNTQAAATDIEHVVSRYDAHHSGGYAWSSKQKEQFSNDFENQVSALEYVNRTLKNKYLPKKFIHNMNQSALYSFAEGKLCEYVIIYVNIKVKYNLNFERNDMDFLIKNYHKCKQ